MLDNNKSRNAVHSRYIAGPQRFWKYTTPNTQLWKFEKIGVSLMLSREGLLAHKIEQGLKIWNCKTGEKSIGIYKGICKVRLTTEFGKPK